MIESAEGRPKRLSLRARILLYLISIHVLMAGISIAVVVGDRNLLFLVEGFLIASAVMGILLVRAFFVPLELIRTGADLITERDFTSRFRNVGQPEMDALIAVYNRMIDRLREERLLLEERNLFIEKVVEATPAGIVILDFNGFIEHMNSRASALLQATHEEKRIRLEDINHPLAEKVASVELGHSEIVSPDGWRRFRVHRGSFMDRGFSRQFFLLEELTDELRASEKAAYEKLVRMMSHEVKNSVGAVQSLLDSFRTYGVQLRAEDRHDFDHALSIAISRMSNLDSFTNSFAEVVRLPPPERSRFDLDRLLRDLLLLVEPEMRARSIRVVFDGLNQASVNADKNQMEQVFVNILRNAMESIDNGGTIEIRIDRNDRGIGATVADDGPGISPDLEGKLFTPFLSTKRDGHGIGLTLIHEILTNHGFEFSLRNRPARGAEFQILF